ncbi:MAG: ester cyclase [Anaerolineae bacterium]|nr:MAG: ester cyclase [Anaerolineae bacterium]
MDGFDDEFVDIVDYIVKITHKIWEETGVGFIYDYYQPNCSVHTPSGLSYGREEVVAGTLKLLSAFPDRELHADDVIWVGNDRDGYHTSHRITSEGHNTGYSDYGPPTGRQVVWRAIANCFVKDNRIVEEWLVRDELNLVRQLGFDAQEIAANSAQQDFLQPTHGEIDRVLGQTTPEALPPEPTGDFDIEDFVRRSYHEIWNWRRLDRIHSSFSEDYLCHTASGREFENSREYKAFLLSMLGMFPDAKMTIDHLYWNGSEVEGYRAAVRWSLVGTHSGPGIYGEPTGKRVRIMGISHHQVRGGEFVEEWTVFDEIALMKQLYAPDASAHARDISGEHPPDANTSVSETIEKSAQDASEQD